MMLRAVGRPIRVVERALVTVMSGTKIGRKWDEDCREAATEAQGFNQVLTGFNPGTIV
jgi:hypothetical protein